MRRKKSKRNRVESSRKVEKGVDFERRRKFTRKREKEMVEKRGKRDDKDERTRSVRRNGTRKQDN